MTARAAAVAGVVALLLGGCAGSATLPSTRDPLPANPDPAPAPSGSALEQSMHELVNRRRATRGRPPLRWDNRVAEIAREHSQAMASGRRPFSHDGFDERAAAIRAFVDARSMAENVAYDSRTGPELGRLVVEGWIASSGHRQNLEGDFTVTGIGAAEGQDGVWYFTQIFVKTAGP